MYDNLSLKTKMVRKIRFSEVGETTNTKAFPVVELSRQGYKIRKVFG